MLSLYHTLSARYLRRRWVRATLIVVSIAAGVSMLVATSALNQTMARAAVASSNPLAGASDLLVSNGDAPLDRSLTEELARIDGVKAVTPLVFENVRLPTLDNHPALLVGVALDAATTDIGPSLGEVEDIDKVTRDAMLAALHGQTPVVVSKDLAAALDAAGAESNKALLVQSAEQAKLARLARVGTITVRGSAAALARDVLIVELKDAARLAGLKPGKVTRIDLALAPDADRADVQHRVAEQLAGRAEVHTPEEQNQAVHNVMSSMQLMLLLCGVVALVIGLFLVYNALSVSVAERRHDIGILLAVGASRRQICWLFAGEAALLGLAGSLLGIPLGVGLAYLGLQPMRDVLQDIFLTLNASAVEVGRGLILVALTAGVLTAVAASLLPAVLAAREEPADAVRRIPPTPTWRYRFLQVFASTTCVLIGLTCVLMRSALPPRVGLYGGLGLALIGGLLAMPLMTALLAGLLQPLTRHLLGIEGRLAADNLVRSPGRTGLVIAALAAGVALVMGTTGIIRSNRETLHEWVRTSLPADLMVTSGARVGSSGQGRAMTDKMGKDIAALPDVQAALPVRKQFFRDTQVFMIAINAADFYEIDRLRIPDHRDVPVYKVLSERPDGAIVSENFAALYGVGAGDTITLPSPTGPVTFYVVGTVADYSWNHGVLLVDLVYYRQRWDDDRVDVFDIYVAPGTEEAVRQRICSDLPAELSLVVQSKEELRTAIDGIIDRLYGIAYAQQVVVMFVAALGVVTALLISVLQRRRELGLLRAVGATRGQVLRSVLAEAILMGVIGAVIGLIVGMLLQWYALRVAFFEETGYLFPVTVPWLAALLIAAAALLCAALSGLGPALHAVRQPITEAVTVE